LGLRRGVVPVSSLLSMAGMERTPMKLVSCATSAILTAGHPAIHQSSTIRLRSRVSGSSRVATPASPITNAT
jgi:hypothetical protein